MSRKRCNRKPARINFNPVATALRRARPLPSDEARQIELRHTVALDALAHGKATAGDMHDIVGMVNMVTAILNGKGTASGHPYAVEGFDLAPVKDALRSINERRRRLGRIGVSGPELTQLRNCLSVHVALMSTLPVGDLLRALDYLERRYHSGDVEVLRAAPAPDLAEPERLAA